MSFPRRDGEGRGEGNDVRSLSLERNPNLGELQLRKRLSDRDKKWADERGLRQGRLPMQFSNRCFEGRENVMARLDKAIVDLCERYLKWIDQCADRCRTCSPSAPGHL